MRFPKQNYTKLPDERIKRKFLWFPKALKSSQYRWLEYANIKEIVTIKAYWGIYIYDWEESEFVD